MESPMRGIIIAALASCFAEGTSKKLREKALPFIPILEVINR